jgi:hypothetical protein
MSIKFRDLTLGEQLTFVVSKGSADLSAVPITVVLDAQDGGSRFVFRWLNGGTDGELTDGNTKVRFTKPAAWTAEHLTAGTWTVRFLAGDDGTTQYQIGFGSKRIIQPAPGPLPTANP